MAPKGSNRNQQKRCNQKKQHQTTKQTNITRNKGTISIPTNIFALDTEGFHHILSDIYDYFDNGNSIWETIPRIADIALGAGVSGIIAYMSANSNIWDSGFLNVFNGIKWYLFLIVGSFVMYFVSGMIRKKAKNKRKQQYYIKFENAPQLTTIPIEATLSSVPSINSQKLNTMQ